jgi:hypothetical protein
VIRRLYIHNFRCLDTIIRKLGDLQFGGDLVGALIRGDVEP